MARRKDAQKLDELGKLCDTHSGLEKILKAPDRPKGITKILEKDLETVGADIIRTAKEWAEIKNNNKSRGGPTT